MEFLMFLFFLSFLFTVLAALKGASATRPDAAGLLRSTGEGTRGHGVGSDPHPLNPFLHHDPHAHTALSHDPHAHTAPLHNAPGIHDAAGCHHIHDAHHHAHNHCPTPDSHHGISSSHCSFSHSDPSAGSSFPSDFGSGGHHNH
jgi:hypothetical protein